MMDNGKELADKLDEQYGKPLEAEHWGEYVAISPEGRTVLAATLMEVVQKAPRVLGPGSFVFKIGPKTVGNILDHGARVIVEP